MRVLCAFLAATATLLGGTTLKAEDRQSVELKMTAAPGDQQQVKAVLEISGQLKLNADGKQVTKLPLEVHAEHQYVERLLESNGVPGTRRSCRFYEKAQADIKLGKEQLNPQLGEQTQLVVVELKKSRPHLFSPLGPLTRDQLDLLDVPGCSLLLPDLLPAGKTTVGDSWKHDGSLIAGLLGLDAVSQSDVKSTLESIQDGVARIQMSGTVSGAAGGIASEIKLAAKYNFDVAQQRVTWLALSIQENRSIGHAEPGFEVVARLRMAVGQGRSEQLSDDVLAQLPLKAHAGNELLEFRATQGGFRVLHDRGWRVMLDRHDVTVLRLVDRGDLLAQGNFSPLPELPKGEQLVLEAFQADIQKTLGDKFGQFIEASQQVNDNGLRVLRVEVAGTVEKLPIHWTYYHLSDDSGRRLAAVFTREAELTERFGAADQSLISSLQFLEPSAASAASKDDGDEVKRR